jgi:hypothetical protein
MKVMMIEVYGTWVRQARCGCMVDRCDLNGRQNTKDREDHFTLSSSNGTWIYASGSFLAGLSHIFFTDNDTAWRGY